MLRTLFKPGPILFAITLLAISHLAAAQAPLPRYWRHTASLPPGTPIIIHQPHQPAIYCTLVWIDTDAIACDTPQRVIYPAASVTLIKPQRIYSGPGDHPRAIYIAMAIGGLLGGLVGSQAGVGAGFAMAGVGALIGASAASGPHLFIYP